MYLKYVCSIINSIIYYIMENLVKVYNVGRGADSPEGAKQETERLLLSRFGVNLTIVSEVTTDYWCDDCQCPHFYHTVEVLVESTESNRILNNSRLTVKSQEGLKSFIKLYDALPK